jgi:hypothetical protein
MIDPPSGVVLLDSNRNRVDSTGRGRCSYSGLIGTSVRIGASVGVMFLFHHSCRTYDYLIVGLG